MTTLINGYNDIPLLLRSIMILFGAALAGLILHTVIFFILRFMGKRADSFFIETFITHCRRSLLVIILLFFIGLVKSSLTLNPSVAFILERSLTPFFVLAFAWLAVGIVSVLEDMILNQFSLEGKDNLRARRVRTQTSFLKRVAVICIGILALGLILMTFETVRQLGTSILASAGVVGLLIGIAAQRYIGNLLAGLQIAFTQPMRIDDVVIVENEWGRIEEIALTYVVVRIWDLRRLVLPISYFIEKPFQNWTRVTADLMGTVFLYVDYTIPVEELRTELRRILEESAEWDGKVCVVQVTNTSEKAMEVRALMSASDASLLWNLRCEVREKLVTFIQRHYPGCLPRLRTEIIGGTENHVTTE